MRTVLWLMSLAVISTQAYAQETINYGIHQVYIAPRSLASGGSFTVIDDYNSLFYNPAELARRTEGELNLGFYAGITSNALSFEKSVTDAAGAQSDSDKISGIQTAISAAYGNNYATRVGALSAIWARPRWGLGIVLGDVTVDLAVHRDLGPQIGIQAYVDNTLAFGYSKGYLENNALTIGATAKVIYRGYVGRNVSAFDLAVNPSFLRTSDALEGMTIDGDIGAEYVLPPPDEGLFKWMKFAKPTLGLVVRNVADYGFSQNAHLIDKKSGSNPPNLGRRFDVGSKWQLPDFWVFHPKFMFDERDMSMPYFTFVKGLHTGFELGWTAFSWLRGYYSIGYGQGYVSGGVGAQLTWFRLDVATWGEEVGTSNQPAQERYFLARLSLDF